MLQKIKKFFFIIITSIIIFSCQGAQDAIQGKKRGILSVLLQTFYTIEYCFTVNEHVFIPPPKVPKGLSRSIFCFNSWS